MDEVDLALLEIPGYQEDIPSYVLVAAPVCSVLAYEGSGEAFNNFLTTSEEFYIWIVFA